MSPKLAAKYNALDGALNVTRIRIAGKNGKVRFRSLSYTYSFWQIKRLVQTFKPGDIVHVLSSLDAEKNYRRELKRGYYDYDKAKKYFP